MEKYKCAWIENMLSIEPDGYARPCCLETGSSARISHIDDGILNAFNHDKLLKLRSNLEIGFNEYTRPYCFRCESLEVRGEPSLRNTAKFLSERRELKLLQFKLSNRCQLACFHCGPLQSSTWSKKLNITPHVKKALEINDRFLDELAQLLPNLTVIKFTGGEPFLDPDHWKILNFLKQYDRSHCELYYITNGISPVRPELWDGWKEITCSVSVDGFEETYEWFRRGSSWGGIIEGVDKLKNHSRVEINFSITPFTIQDYNKSLSFWGELKPIPIVMPKQASIIEFPKEIIEKIDGYENIPFQGSSTENNLQMYIDWAKRWDSMWDTTGWAEKLYWWVK